MIKTYKSINSVNLYTSVILNGKSVNLSFEGGYVDASGKATNGTFTTDDEQLQQAIESDSSYGKSFILVGGAAKVKVSQGANTGADNEGFEKVQGITNTQAAVEWLTANKEVVFEKIPKAADVKAKALELKVDFVEWK